jgi:hypothetical protein
MDGGICQHHHSGSALYRPEPGGTRHAGALARGDAAINLRFPRIGYREKIWDHAAGALIVEEAGGRISDASGEPSLAMHAPQVQHAGEV